MTPTCDPVIGDLRYPRDGFDRIRAHQDRRPWALPRLRQARATDEGGRGLYLVNRLAKRWGATRLSAGKVVWFELNPA